jgi:predicted dehydrogenase
MTELGVVIVGAGEMGLRHAVKWFEAGAKVIGVFDPDQKRAKRVASRLDAEAFTETETSLDRSDVHIVSVCTPTYLHAKYTVEALDAGKHVLCEKPAALTLPDALRMKEAALRNGRELRIGFMRRFDSASHQIMAFRQKIGDPVMAQATLAAGVRPKLLMHDAAANGGPIIDMCCHIFDQWVALFGEQPETVRAHGYTFSENKIELAAIRHKALDSAHITLAYPSGAVGHIHVSWGLPSGIKPLEYHTYMAPEGLITVDWPKQVTLMDASGTNHWKGRGVDPWLTQITQFYRELLDGEPRHLATIDDGIEALRTSLAVLESVAQEREVRPAEITGEMPDLPQKALGRA